MLRQRQIRLLALLTVGGGGSYALYRYSRRNNDSRVGSTFRIPIKQQDAQGKRINTVMEVPYLKDAVLEKRVKTFSRNLFTEQMPSDSRNANAVINFSGAQLNSNEPIEDMEPEAIVYTYEDSARRPLIVGLVADGHSGSFTSTWLSKGQLSQLMIGTLLMSNGFKINFPPLDKQTGTISIPSAFRVNPKQMEAHIKKSFVSVDQYLVWQMPKMLMEQLAGKGKESTDPSKLAGQILPGYSGACALAAVIDTEDQNMWVAVTGDCRAVAGYYDRKEDGTGTWRVDVLSEDQTAESPKEVARYVAIIVQAYLLIFLLG
jgi:pyruvate dehydrogenase phosphatase